MVEKENGKRVSIETVKVELLNRLEDQAIRSLRVILKMVNLREANKKIFRNVLPFKIFLKILLSHICIIY